MTSSTIRVVLADDQALVRAGFSALLGAQEDIEVVGEAGDGEEAVRLAADLMPDIVLMDIRMAGVDGLAATRRIAPDKSAIHSAPSGAKVRSRGNTPVMKSSTEETLPAPSNRTRTTLWPVT